MMVDGGEPPIASQQVLVVSSSGGQGVTDPAVFRETTLWGAALRTVAAEDGFLQGILAVWQPLADVTGNSQSGDSESGAWAGGPRLFTYEIQSGDTLWSLARRYGTDVDTLLRINNLTSPHRLHLGQKIRILTVPGLVHSVRRGETVEKIAQTYKISPAAIIMANNITDPNHIRVGQELILPGAVPPPPKPAAAESGSAKRRQESERAGADSAEASSARKQADISREREEIAARGGIPTLIWPVEGPISSYYGPRWGTVHEGIDIAVPVGTPVRAAAGGTVVYTGAYGAYGLLVIIDHGNGITTRYGHNSRILVTVGERVERGDVIAKSGNTGRSTGPHVHFEVRKNGRPLNPLGYLPQ